jgi:hypothetical protein
VTTEPHVALAKPLLAGRLIPELCGPIAHVLAHYDVSRRFRSGVVHLLHKSLPQRSGQKHMDRGSAAHLEDAETLLFVSHVLCDARPDIARSSITASFIAAHFHLCMLAVRRCVCLHLEHVPGLRALADVLFDADACVAATQAAVAAQSMSPDLPTIIPKSGAWNFSHFTRTTLELLRPHCDLSHFTDMLHALHAALSRGLAVGDALTHLGVTPDLVQGLRASLRVRRRLRKTKVRELLQRASAYDKVALQLVLRAQQRAQLYSRTVLPSSAHPHPRDEHNDHALFLACTVCCTCRSAVGGNGARGASRCLYDFDTGAVTCGRKGNSAALCSNTPLLQTHMVHAVLHVGGQGFFARCNLCACFYKYGTASWNKGALTCEACKYLIVDDQPLGAACEHCGQAYTTPVDLTPHDTGDVYVRSRRCATCTCAAARAPASAASSSHAAPATTTSGGSPCCT